MKNNKFMNREYFVIILTIFLLTFVIRMSFFIDYTYNEKLNSEIETIRIDSVQSTFRYEKDSIWRNTISENVDSLFKCIDSLNYILQSISISEEQSLKQEIEIKRSLKQYFTNQSK